MTFIATTAPADARDEVRAMYQRQQDAWGFVPNYAKVFSGRPEVLARWGRLQAEIKRPMPDARFEIVSFAAAIALRSSACSLQYGRRMAARFGENTVMAMRIGILPDSMSRADQAIFHYARKVARDATRITAGDVDRLRDAGLTDEEIFDVAAAAAGRAFFTKLLDALGAEADDVHAELDEHFRRALTVGRPIAFEATESLPVTQTSAGGPS